MADETVFTAHSDPDPIRLVLFGMPAAGKSSLLGALQQASGTQQRQLQGRFTDISHGLDTLRNRVYSEAGRETLDEIVPYPAWYERLTSGAQPRVPLILYDCDGRIANDLLSKRKNLGERPAPGSLADAVLHADGLIVAVDASASPTQMESDFREFGRFLGELQESRSRTHAVGRLPVTLALSKCDLLGSETISRSLWESRIAERKNQVVERFRRIIDEQGDGFGSVMLDVSATAVRTPALLDAPAKPQEPFGVAEAFSRAFTTAQDYRTRSKQADRRLGWTVSGAGGFVAAMAAGIVYLMGFGGPREQPLTLAEKVEEFRAKETLVTTRLNEPKLPQRVKDFEEFLTANDFNTLPADLQAYLRDSIAEASAYKQFREQLRVGPDPGTATSLSELGDMRRKLETDLMVPQAYRTIWDKAGMRDEEKPEAVRERDRRIVRTRTIAKTVEDLRGFLLGCRTVSSDLLHVKTLNLDWLREIDELTRKINTPPALPDAEVAMRFEEVTTVRDRDLLVSYKRLLAYRNFAQALGLLGTNGPLTPPDTVPVEGINAQAEERLNRLQAIDPAFSDWSMVLVPEETEERFRERLQASLDRLREDGQRLLARTDPAIDWPKRLAELGKPEVSGWRRLTTQVQKWVDPQAEDPVASAEKFVKATSFPVLIRGASLRMPDQFGGIALNPAGPWKLTITPQGGPAIVYTLNPSPTVIRDGARHKIVKFVTDKPIELTLKPSDAVVAELPIRDGDKTYTLTWNRNRLPQYPLERLTREPSLHPADRPADIGNPVREAILTIEGTWPLTPALLPTPPQK